MKKKDEIKVCLVGSSGGHLTHLYIVQLTFNCSFAKSLVSMYAFPAKVLKKLSVNGSGNIHVHIVINSLRKLDVPPQPFMERPIDCKAGYKHHVTNEYLKHLQKSLMDLCNREFLYQVDLLAPSRTGVTEAEYWAQRRLDEKKQEIEKEGFTPNPTKFQTQKQVIRDAVAAAREKAISYEDFQDILQDEYDIFVKTQRGRYSYLPPERSKFILHERERKALICFSALERQEEKLSAEKAEIVKQRVALYEQYADGNMSKEEFIRQRDAYRAQEDERMGQIQRLRTEKNQIFLPVKKDTDNLQAMMNTVGEAGDVMHLSQNVVETFIDRIEVFNDERVKIHFTFEDTLKSYETG